MATSRKKKAAKRPTKSSKATGSSVPQLSESQKLVLRKQYEEMQDAKVRVANAVLQIDQAEAQLEELKRATNEKSDQFTEACKSALRGAGIDLEDSSRAYTLDVTDMSVKESLVPPPPVSS